MKAPHLHGSQPDGSGEFTYTAVPGAQAKSLDGSCGRSWASHMNALSDDAIQAMTIWRRGLHVQSEFAFSENRVSDYWIALQKAKNR